ncbi:hypothetical protein GH714_012633 [Hevea brasiliensis]|uniref:Uncharacterized protein n=1 Tax=Hevea brasiliensis TaxID=3981 RepID=A0A6A6LSB9_HEVBR|nr:hypothetical protein GH714_012633 [Hevea brasiliensis]
MMTHNPSFYPFVVINALPCQNHGIEDFFQSFAFPYSTHHSHDLGVEEFFFFFFVQRCYMRDFVWFATSMVVIGLGVYELVEGGLPIMDERSKEYWHVVTIGVAKPVAGSTLSEAQKVELESSKLKGLKAKNYLFQAIDRPTLETILCKDTSKKICRERWFKNFSRTMAIANKTRIHGERLEDVTIMEKILRLMIVKFNVAYSIEKSKDIDALLIDELQSSLLLHEQKINQQEKRSKLKGSNKFKRRWS